MLLTAEGVMTAIIKIQAIPKTKAAFNVYTSRAKSHQ